MATDFSLAAAIEIGEDAEEARVDCSGAGIVIDYLSPSALEGMTYTFLNGQATIAFRELPEQTVRASAVDTSSAGLIACAFEDAVLQSSGGTIRGVTPGGSYTLRLNRETGLPESLEVPDRDFSCTFTQTAE